MKRVEWNAENIGKLRMMYGSHTAQEIADCFGTSKNAIYQRCHELGLIKKPRRRSNVTEQDRLWLIRNYPHIRNEICAIYLDMSVRTLCSYARQLGLKKTAEYMRQTNLAAGKLRSRKLKGVYSPNLQKGVHTQIKPGQKLRQKNERNQFTKNTA